MGLTAREGVALTDQSALEILVRTEKFLGGDADLGSGDVSFGRVRLQDDKLSHRLSLSSTTAIGKGETLNVFTGAHFPGDGTNDWSAGIRYRMGLWVIWTASSASRMYQGAGRPLSCVEASLRVTAGAQAAVGIGCNCARNSPSASPHAAAVSRS